MKLGYQDVLPHLELRKLGKNEGYDILYKGTRIGSVSMGWSRLGGKGWTALFDNTKGRSPYQDLTSAHKNLNEIKQSIAHRIIRANL